MEKYLVSLRLDIPMEKKEVTSRGMSEALSRMVIEGTTAALAEAILRCRPQGKEIFVHAVGAIETSTKQSAVLKGLGIEVSSPPKAVGVATSEQLEALLSTWPAEVLVIFFSDQAAATTIVVSLGELEPKWWTFSEESFESPYLKQLHLADPFLFFSPTLSAIEAIGSAEKILDCFNEQRALLRRAPGE